MKEGDKVCCKKEIIGNVSRIPIYKHNRYYAIDIAYKSGYLIEGERNVCVPFDKKEIHIEGHRYIWDYFYTIPKLRKAKLKKLYEKR